MNGWLEYIDDKVNKCVDISVYYIEPGVIYKNSIKNMNV